MMQFYAKWKRISNVRQYLGFIVRAQVDAIFGSTGARGGGSTRHPRPILNPSLHFFKYTLVGL